MAENEYGTERELREARGEVCEATTPAQELARDWANQTDKMRDLQARLEAITEEKAQEEAILKDITERLKGLVSRKSPSRCFLIPQNGPFSKRRVVLVKWVRGTIGASALVDSPPSAIVELCEVSE